MAPLAALARRHALDALVVAGAAEAALEVAFRDAPPRTPTSPAWLAVPAVLACVLPLLARRRLPFAAPAAVWIVGAALSFVDGRLVPFASGVYAAGLVAAFLLGNLADARQGRIGLAIVLGGSTCVVVRDPSGSAGPDVLIPLLFALAWLGGFALRERAAQAEDAERRAVAAERERDAAARIAVAEERARIARELHDVVAHAVSVMVLQAGAVRHRLPPSLAAEGEALRAVEATGRDALAEMRQLLGALRREDDPSDRAPQPGLAALDGLVAEVRAAGLDVHVLVDGEPRALPPSLDLSAYRIVQEGLTNALRHAAARRADVTIRYAPDEVGIEVRDDGRGADGQGAGGHGLVGVRERVKVFGGEMTAGSADGAGFVLATRLPIPGAAP